MTTAIRERLLVALEAAFASLTTGGTAVTVYRNRRKPVPMDRWPALILHDGGHAPPDDGQTFASQYRLEVTLEGLVGATSSLTMTEAELGPALSDLYAAARDAAFADRTLGGLAIDMHEGALSVDTDRGEGKAPAGRLELGLTIDYWNQQASAYLAGP